MTEKAPTNSDIMRVLGRMEEGISRLRIDLDNQVLHARENDRVLFDKLDEQNSRLNTIAEAGLIQGQITAQVRDKLETFDGKLKNDVYPVVDKWNGMVKLGIGLAGLLALGGLSLGASLVWFGDTVNQAIRHWLRLP